jgi:phosphonate transport system permease protein
MTLVDERSEATAPDRVDLDSQPLRPRWSWQRKVLAALAVVYTASVVWSIRRTGLSVTALVDGYGDFRRLLDRMLPVEFRDPGRIIELAFETFFIAFIGTALAIVVSIPLAVCAARNTTPHRLLYGPARGFIVAMRAIPDLVFALIFVRAVGIGVLAGILAIGLHAIGMIGKLYADAIEQIDEGPREAVLATGAGRIQSLVTGVLPQVLPAFIGVGMYRLDINFRTSTILGYVGAGGIGSLLQLYLGSLQYSKALGVVMIIVVLVLAVEFLSASVRKSILGGDVYADRSILQRIRLTGHRAVGGRRSAVPDVMPIDDDIPVADVLAFDPIELRPPWTPQRKRMTFWGSAALVTLVYSFWSTGVTPWRLFGSFGDVFRVGFQLVPRDMSWANSGIWNGILETLAIGIAATTLGLLVSVPLAFLCARNVAPARAVYYFGRTLLVVNRALPDLIIAVLFVSAVGLGPFPGVMALSIGTIGFATKLLADSIEEVRQGPRDAIAATGASRLQESATGVTPQVMPALVGTSLYVLDINIRAATVLGLVGAGGIGFYLIQATRTLDWERVGGILISVFLVVYAIELLSGWVRKQLL